MIQGKVAERANQEAEDLFRIIAEVFIYWSKSHVQKKYWQYIVSYMLRT